MHDVIFDEGTTFEIYKIHFEYVELFENVINTKRTINFLSYKRMYEIGFIWNRTRVMLVKKEQVQMISQ